MPRVWFITACFGRFEITRLCLEQRALVLEELRAMGYEAHCVVAGDDENLDIAREFEMIALDRPNRPLGRKVNDMIEYACREGEADFVVTLGSDDWCLASQFRDLPDDLTVKASGHVAIVDPTGERILLVHCDHRFGYIPWVIPRALLESSVYRPAEDGAQSGIDGSINWSIRSYNQDVRWSIVTEEVLQLVDFKSPTNLNSYELTCSVVKKASEGNNPFALLAMRYPADLCERMEGMYRRGFA